MVANYQHAWTFNLTASQQFTSRPVVQCSSSDTPLPCAPCTPWMNCLTAHCILVRPQGVPFTWQWLPAAPLPCLCALNVLLYCPPASLEGPEVCQPCGSGSQRPPAFPVHPQCNAKPSGHELLPSPPSVTAIDTAACTEPSGARNGSTVAIKRPSPIEVLNSCYGCLVQHSTASWETEVLL